MSDEPEQGEAPESEAPENEASEGAQPEERAPSEPSEPPSPAATREAIGVSIGVTIGTGLVIAFAFDPVRAGTRAMLIAMGLFYAVVTVFTLRGLHRRGDLGPLFRPARGDLSFGALTAGLLYGATHIAQMTLAGHGTPREGWVMRLYLQLGDPRAPGRALVGGAVFVIAGLEEIVWRALVMRKIQAAAGGTRAVLFSSALFALAHVSTMFLLRDPVAGLNPLVVLAALGCGIVWGLLVLRTRRFVPSLFAHALFSWAIVEFPVWRP